MKSLITCILLLQSIMGYNQSLRQLSVENGKIHYISMGEGECIVFVHGAQEDYRMFLPQLEALQNKYRLISYSRRYNYPNNNDLQDQYNVRSEARDLEALINHLDQPIHLVGHSYGGLIAMELAIAKPELIHSLILSEPALVDWLPQFPDCAHWHDSVMINLNGKVRAAFMTRDTTNILKAIFEFFAGADLQHKVPVSVLESLKSNLLEMKALVYAENGFEARRQEELQSLDKPIMTITTAQTMPMLQCTNKHLVELLPKATHHLLDEAGHELWITHSPVMTDILDKFIEEIRVRE